MAGALGPRAVSRRYAKPCSDSLAKPAKTSLGQAAKLGDWRNQACSMRDQYISPAEILHVHMPAHRPQDSRSTSTAACLLQVHRPTAQPPTQSIHGDQLLASGLMAAWSSAAPFKSGCQLPCHVAWKRGLFYAFLPRNQTRPPAGKPYGTPNHGRRCNLSLVASPEAVPSSRSSQRKAAVRPVVEATNHASPLTTDALIIEVLRVTDNQVLPNPS